MKRHSREHVREQSLRHKNRVKRIIKDSWIWESDEKHTSNLLSPKFIGKAESTHLKMCSCSMCRNARKDEGETLQERKFKDETNMEEGEVLEEEII